MTILRKLALGLYQLSIGWKRDADRRLQMSAILATMFIVNLICVRSILRDLYFESSRFSDVHNLTILVISAVIWLVMHKIVVTSEVFLQIKASSLSDPQQAEAKSFFLYYLASTFALMMITLVVAVR